MTGRRSFGDFGCDVGNFLKVELQKQGRNRSKFQYVLEFHYCLSNEQQ
jgi:hypothetical protein